MAARPPLDYFRLLRRRSARPMDISWARGLRNQSVQAGVAFFLKQLGGRRGKRSGDQAVMDGETWRQMPFEEPG